MQKQQVYVLTGAPSSILIIMTLNKTDQSHSFRHPMLVVESDLKHGE